MKIKIPTVGSLTAAIQKHTEATGFTQSFRAYLGDGGGTTVQAPDFPTPGSNLYVWYYTENGRQGRALLQGGLVPYASADSYYGLPVQIGKMPGAYGIQSEVVLGLGGMEGMIAAGGTSITDQYVTNNYYVTGDRINEYRIGPGGGLIISVSGPVVYANPSTGVLSQFSSTTLDLTTPQGALASGKHCLVAIVLDPYTGALGYVASTAATASGSLPARSELGITTIQTLDLTDKIRIGTVYLYYGQSAIIAADILTDLDLRSWFSPPEIARRLGGVNQSAKSGTYNATVHDRYIGLVGGATVVLPKAADFGLGNFLYIKNDDNTAGASPVTINTYAGDTFGAGLTTATLSTNAEAKMYMVIGATQWLLVVGYRNKFTGDAGSGGQGGTVPAPAAGDTAAGKFLKADATWAVPTGSSAPTGAVILAPTSSTRNLIQPTSDYIALRIRGSVGQSNDILSVEDSGANTLMAIRAGGNQFASLRDATTTGAASILEFGHVTSGTPAATFGSAILFQAQSTSFAAQSQARVRSEWVIPTHASRTSKLVLSAFNVASETDGLEIGPTGIVKIPNGILDMNTHLISNVVDPSGTQDAATKNYIDTKTIDLTHGGTGVDLHLAGGAGYVLKQDAGHVITAAALVSGDLPSHTHAAGDVTSGTLAIAQGGTNAATANANVVFAGPTTGAAAAPSFRALVDADIPNHSAARITSGVLALVDHASVTNATTNATTLLVKGVGSQTSPQLEVQNSAAQILVQVPVGGGINVRGVDGSTTSQLGIFNLYHTTSATPANGLGLQLVMSADTNGATDQLMFKIVPSWIDATNASRKAVAQFLVYDTAQREGFRIQASGAAPMIGFFGGGAAVKQTVTGAKGSNAALGSLLTALAAYGFITDSSSA